MFPCLVSLLERFSCSFWECSWAIDVEQAHHGAHLPDGKHNSDDISLIDQLGASDVAGEGWGAPC